MFFCELLKGNSCDFLLVFQNDISFQNMDCFYREWIAPRDDFVPGRKNLLLPLRVGGMKKM